MRFADGHSWPAMRNTMNAQVTATKGHLRVGSKLSSRKTLVHVKARTAPRRADPTVRAEARSALDETYHSRPKQAGIASAAKVTTNPITFLGSTGRRSKTPPDACTSTHVVRAAHVAESSPQPGGGFRYAPESKHSSHAHEFCSPRPYLREPNLDREVNAPPHQAHTPRSASSDTSRILTCTSHGTGVDHPAVRE